MLVGVGAVPVISFITFFIGVIMALQGALHLIADTVATSITRELGPLVTAGLFRDAETRHYQATEGVAGKVLKSFGRFIVPAVLCANPSPGWGNGTGGI